MRVHAHRHFDSRMILGTNSTKYYEPKYIQDQIVNQHSPCTLQLHVLLQVPSTTKHHDCRHRTNSHSHWDALHLVPTRGSRPWDSYQVCVRRANWRRPRKIEWIHQRESCFRSCVWRAGWLQFPEERLVALVPPSYRANPNRHPEWPWPRREL